MRARGAAIQGGLAALGLALAYGTWQREPERAPGEVVVVQASKTEVQKVRYEDGKKGAELTRRTDGDDTITWVKVSASADGKVPERELRGNPNADKLFEGFGPLHASRALGVLDAAKLKELGVE